jgi:hypothetical protein
VNRKMTALFAALALAGTAPLAAQKAPDNWEGLVKVPSKKIELVYLAPGADFRPYTKVMIDPTEAAFRKDWLRDQRRSSGSFSLSLSEKDVLEATDDAKKEFEQELRAAYAKAGYEIVTTPAADVLRVATGVIDIDVVAPDTQSAGRSRSYSEDAGAATLVVEVRDSVSGAILGRAVERRIAGDNGPWIRNRVTNYSDFEKLFKRWAEVCAEGLGELKALSPIPEQAS